MYFHVPRRRLAASAGILIAALAVAGCSNSNEDPNDEASLTIFAQQGAEFDLETNSFSLEMEELTGYDFDWQTTTQDAGAAAEARQIALASGDYPEVFMLIPWVDQFSQDELMRFGEQGVLLPLNDLIQEHAPNVVQAFEDHPEYEALATAPDGNVYGLPQWVDCFHCSFPSKLWLNSDWLETLGLAMPTTTDELFEVLLAFKTQDPNGNGIADEIPLTSSVDDQLLPFFVNAFLYDPRGSNANQSSVALDGDTVVEQAAQDAYRDALAYMAELYDAGLIDNGAFTQNRDALTALGNNADAVIVGAAAMMHPGILATIGQEDGRDRAYDPVPPLVGPDGEQNASHVLSTSPGATFALTNKASENEQIAALKLLDYMFSTEGHLRAQFGEEGTSWRGPQDGDVALDPELEPLFAQIPLADGESPRNDAWASMAQYNDSADFRNSNIQPLEIYEPTGYERRLFEATQLYEPHVPEDQVFPATSIWIPADVSAENAELTTNIQGHITSASAEFVAGIRDITSDAAWQSYLDELESLGLDRYLEIRQEAYDAIS